MSTPKIFESEYRFCLILWEHEPVKSSELVNLCKEQLGWKPTTTYTVIKKIEAKGYIKRTDPGFICVSLISKKDVCESETQGLIDKLFGGSRKALFSALLEDEKLTQDEIDELRKLIAKR